MTRSLRAGVGRRPRARGGAGDAVTRIKRKLAFLRGPYRHVRKGARFAGAVAMQHMPGDSLRFGPPRHAGVASEIAESGGQAYDPRHVAPRERLVFDGPRTMTPEADFWSLVERSPDLAQFRRQPDGARYFDIRPGTVYTVPRGRALGSEGWVVDARDRLLTDLSPDYVRERYIRSRHPVMTQLRLPVVRSVDGAVAVLATLSARDFFAHWMMDLLPRAAMIARAGFRFEDMDAVYLPKPHLQYQLDLLTRLGIDPEQIIDADAVPHLQATQLIVPSPHANVFIASTWCCKTLRALVPSHAEAGEPASELIYVSRAHTNHRRLLNEDELLRDVLAPRGFVMVRPERLTLEQQATIFASAKVIVTPLGSSVVNLVHCRPGTQVVEVLNPRCVQTCALALASQLSLGHHVVFAPGVDRRQHEIHEDLLVPPSDLERGIEHALASISCSRPGEL
jgi:capsular polysaccharide biosynthesis protein